MRTSYFFISSPLHLFVATNLAISLEGDKIAVFINKNLNTAKQYGKVAKQFTSLFKDVLVLNCRDKKDTYKKISNALKHSPPDEIFAGNDRRVEFQFAMHTARKYNANVKGAYIDDGAVSYLGHKSAGNFAHKYIDPWLKKIAYGLWYKSAGTTGCTEWIENAYLAFPALAHPLLQKKKLVAISPENFNACSFLELNNALLSNTQSLTDINFKEIKVVLTLPHEASYLNSPEKLEKLKTSIFNRFGKIGIAIKAHPRSENLALLSKAFPDTENLPATIGMEMLLPLLNNDIAIVGEISSTLLTAKWLKPNSTVQVYQGDNKPDEKLALLLAELGITQLDK